MCQRRHLTHLMRRLGYVTRSTRQRATRAKRWHKPQCHDVISHYLSLTRTDLETWPGPNWLQKKILNKKKEEKEKVLTKYNFDFDQKVKIFKNGLFHSVFRVHSDFEIRFFIWSSEIAQTVQFLKNWLLHKSWPKVKIFKKYLSCLIFRVDSISGVYFCIWESEIAQIVWFYNCWL